MTSFAFDASALTAPVTRADVRASQGQRLGDEAGPTLSAGAVALAWLRLLILTACVYVLVLLFLLVVHMLAGGHGVTSLLFVFAAIMMLPFVITQVRGMARGRAEAEEMVHRLRGFVADNHLDYDHRFDGRRADAAFLGANDGRGFHRGIQWIAGTRPRVFEVADYMFTAGRGRASTKRSMTVVRLALRYPLPPAQLHTTDRRAGSPTWEPSATLPEVAIEASFDETFTVRAADADAVRAAFTPVVREALQAIAAHVDVETTGDAVLFVTRRPIPAHRVALWEWVEDLVRAAGVLEGADERFVDDTARARRRDELFAGPSGVGRAWALGCLLPLVCGAIATVLTTVFA